MRAWGGGRVDNILKKYKQVEERDTVIRDPRVGHQLNVVRADRTIKSKNQLKIF